MKEDRLMTLTGVLAVIMALLSFSVGKWIIGGIILLLAFGMFWNRGFGKFNDRSIYEKVIKTDLGIDEIYEKIKDIDTPLGKAWIGGHKGFPGDSIIFGPNAFKDCVVISRKNKTIDVKHITLVKNITRSEEDEKRFTGFIDPRENEVTPKRYSVYASFKLMSVMLVRHLSEIISKLSSGEEVKIPESLEFFKFYYHNSAEGWFRDDEDNDLLRVENSVRPFKACVLNADGEEMASVVPRAFDNRGNVVDSEGYDIYADGEHFGEITRFRVSGRDAFTAKTDIGTFEIRSFPACNRANISCNYTVDKDGELKAVIGSSPNIIFEAEGTCQNDVILSYDDDYLVMYAVMQIFIITLNKKFLK